MPRWREPTSAAPDSTGVVEIRVGRALESLPVLARESRAPFDLTFIDADKVNTPE